MIGGGSQMLQFVLSDCPIAITRFSLSNFELVHLNSPLVGGGI